MIHVCSLALLHETVRATRARRVVTLVDRGTPMRRPYGVAVEDHLRLDVHDVCTPNEGCIHPQEEHVAELIDFVRGWDRTTPMVVHCYAGISRSTAAAFVTACVTAPERDELDFARAIREASPTACPNQLIVSIADRLLAREGRMVAAIEAIAPHVPSYEGVPFRLAL